MRGKLVVSGLILKSCLGGMLRVVYVEKDRGGALLMDELDEEALRERLMDECGTAMFGGFPAALLDVADIESASSDELLEMAERLGVDPEEY